MASPPPNPCPSSSSNGSSRGSSKVSVLKSEIANDLRHGGNGVGSDVFLHSKQNFKSRLKINSSRYIAESINDSFLTDKTHFDRSNSLLKRNESRMTEMTDMCDPENDELEHAVLIAEFTNNVIPTTYAVGKGQLQVKEGELVIKPSFQSVFRTLRQTHFMTAMFYGESLRYSRTSRYLRMFRKMLTGIFCDTVIYGAFFPADTTCRIYVTKKTCQFKQSKVISGSSLCSWNANSNTCSINSPPNEVTFVLLVAFIIAIFLVPLDFIMDFIQEEYASKRPRLEGWGVSTDSWLGSVFHRRDTDVSPIVRAAAYVTQRDSSQRDLSVEEPSRKASSKIEMGAAEADVIAKKIFEDTLTPKEEARRIMTLVRESPYFNVVKDGGVLSTNDALILKAITSKLMLYYDGTPRPLTFRQNLFFKNRDHLLTHRLSAAKKKAAVVCKCITDMEVRSDSIKDIALIRKFILENVNFFYRFSLRRQFNEIDGAPPESIDPRQWVLSWFIIIGVISFFIVWILLWGITNGQATLLSWGTVYGVELLQTIIIYEVVKMTIMYVFAIMSAKPGLQVIKRVINDCALSYIQDSHFTEELSVVQHFSPACRAAHTSSLSSLPSAAILRRMTDADIEKCKEHKNFRLASVIFYILIFAAAIAAVNESCVDQFLDTVVTSMWLGFVLLNKHLLDISPAILVVIYGSIGGYFLYKFLILGPSVKKARRLRDQTNRTKGEFASRSEVGRLHQKDTSFFVQRIKRVYKSMNGYTVGLIVFLSFEGRKSKRRRKRVEALIWLNMNKEPTQQGRIVVDRETSYVGNITFSSSRYVTSLADIGEEDEECKEQDTAPSRNTLSLRRPFANTKNKINKATKIIIPDTILSMRQRQSTIGEVTIAILLEPASAASHLTKFMSKKEGLGASKRELEVEQGYLEAQVMPEISTTPALLKSHGIFAKNYHNNKAITSNANVALRRMLLRHLIGADSYDRGGELNSFDNFKISDTFILMSELVVLMDWVWAGYHPDHQVIGEDRKKEVDEMFQNWRDKVLMECHISGKAAPANGRSRVEGVYFREFSVWFLFLRSVLCPRLTLEDVVEFNDNFLYCNANSRAYGGNMSVAPSRQSGKQGSRQSSVRNSRRYSRQTPRPLSFTDNDDAFA